MVFISLQDCFAADLANGINQGGQQLERVNGDLPEIAEAAEEENVEGEMDWEEVFTDTDTRRGILAVRGDVFQGFGVEERRLFCCLGKGVIGRIRSYGQGGIR